MRGDELTQWRHRHGYTQGALMIELGIRSRQTLSTWENSNSELPRVWQLALKALETFPELRKQDGKRATARQERSMSAKLASRNPTVSQAPEKNFDDDATAS